MWLKIEFGVTVLAMLFLAFVVYQKGRTIETSSTALDYDKRLVLSTLAVAAVWVLCAGYFGVFFGWTPDWNDARADLTSTFVYFSWPVDFGELTLSGSQYLISLPGLYLAPTFIAKLLNSSYSITLLIVALWILIGVSLVLIFVTQRLSRMAERIVAIALFVSFSGLDSVGALLVQDDPLAYLFAGGHLEPWSGTVQFSSSTTLLFWVPHHALSSWLGLIVLTQTRKSKQFLGYVGVTLLFAYLWSPFAAAGLALMGLIFYLHDREFAVNDIVRVIPLSLVIGLGAMPIRDYYSLLTEIPRDLWWYFSERAYLNFGIEESSVLRIAMKYILFLVLELGVWLGLGMWLRIDRKLELLSVGVLLVAISQVVSFGPSDFAMRVSIAPLFYLFLLLSEKLTQFVVARQRIRVRVATVLVTILMIWTPVTEIVENFRRGARSLEPPCVLGGCDSVLTPLQEGFSFGARRPFMFRD